MCYARRQRSSWARIKLSNVLYLKSPKGEVKSQSELDCSLLFVWVVFSLRIFEFRPHTIHESLHVQCLYFPLVVQFSMTDFHAPFAAEPDYYITTVLVCQEVFWNFLKTFSNSLCLPPSSVRLAHYTTSSPVCQYLFANFFGFFQKKFFRRNFQKPLDKPLGVCYNMQADGPLVKRLRHRPLTAKTWVRFPYGSPTRRADCLCSLLFLYFISPVNRAESLHIL